MGSEVVFCGVRSWSVEGFLFLSFREMPKNVGEKFRKTLTDDEDDDDVNMTGPQSPLLS